VGAGRSLEAKYKLKASVKAGTYHFVLDCIVIFSVDMKFELLHRRGTDDVVLAEWPQHFEPLPDSFDAQAYEIDQTAPAIEFTAGDQLVFRYSATAAGTAQGDAWVPNGDGALQGGRIPNITLPK
jgi:hypothetical protein